MARPLSRLRRATFPGGKRPPPDAVEAATLGGPRRAGPCLGVRFLRSETEMATGVRDKITLACTECKRRNYMSTKSKLNTPDRLEVRKYCRWCGRHTPHRETR